MVDPELDELRREFLAEAQGKVREMQSALAGGKSRESLERLAYIAHQLKGSGGRARNRDKSRVDSVSMRARPDSDKSGRQSSYEWTPMNVAFTGRWA